MIVLRASADLKMTFEKLIKTMKVPVNWNGLFVVINNCIILQGDVRSLFFHFESRRVVTNIIDLTIEEMNIKNVGDNGWVKNVINMLLYSFGKWGAIQGLCVEKNYAQLNQLFSDIMKEIGLSSEYTSDHFYFYKEGIRITYEDVMQAALEAKEKEPELPAEKEEEGGLWHKLLWKRERAKFGIKETTVKERQQNRLGNNFYLISYLCPYCKGQMHMVVYPEGREFRIETTEGDVILSRACTCSNCCIYYTPRPKKLLAEGDVFVMDFEHDRKAYEDYQELLGRNGDRVSNHNFNRYADERKNRKQQQESKGDRDLEDEIWYLDDGEWYFSEMTDAEFEDFSAMVEESFFPEQRVKKAEKQIREEKKLRKAGKRKVERRKPDRHGNREEVQSGREEESAGRHGNTKDLMASDRNAVHDKDSNTIERDRAEDNGASRDLSDSRDVGKESAEDGGKKGIGRFLGRGKNGRENEDDSAGEVTASEDESVRETLASEDGGMREMLESEDETGANEATVHADAYEKSVEKYRTRIGQFKRLSERQRKELENQLAKDTSIDETTRRELKQELEETKEQDNLEKLRAKFYGKGEKNYNVLQRLFEEVKAAKLPADEKAELLEEIERQKDAQAQKEVNQLLENKPAKLDRRGYQNYLTKLRSYEGVDISPYEKELEEGKKEAETQEITAMIKNARLSTREDLMNLLSRLNEQEFSPETLNPYSEKILDKVRRLDEEICGNAMAMDFEDALAAYEAVEAGPFLPELKSDALKMLEKRLSKIKTDECELLVQKLQNELKEAKVPEIERHHFYPARKALMKQAAPEEMQTIEYALASYAAGIDKFEYPILVVDTSRTKRGDKGMILTPEKLFYSNLTTSYHISVFSIESIKAMTGLLNRGIYVYQKNGTKTKLPYAVENQNLVAFAETLDGFVKYLQEKPFSRKEVYLAKEKHETICCFRCGYVYKGGNICPKCGYKMNE